MTDAELDAIAQRWEATGKAYRRLSFEAAHQDMLALLAECRERRAENRTLGARLTHADRKTSTLGRELLREIEQLANKYSEHYINPARQEPKA
jgi:hypothetical protein